MGILEEITIEQIKEYRKQHLNREVDRYQNYSTGFVPYIIDRKNDSVRDVPISFHVFFGVDEEDNPYNQEATELLERFESWLADQIYQMNQPKNEN